MSTNTTLFSATVTNGPCAADIVNSFFYSYSPNKLSVRFTVDIQHSAVGYQKGVEFEARITSIGYASGMPGMYIIEFYVTSHSGWGLCKGFYNANQRAGTFEMNMP